MLVVSVRSVVKNVVDVARLAFMFPNVAKTPSHNCPLIGAFGSMTTATAIIRATAHCGRICPSAEAAVEARRLQNNLWHLRDPQVLRSYLALVKGTWLIHTC